jgi:hypothetical protein
MARINFDASAIEPQQPRTGEILPAGTYVAEITDASIKELKSGNGTGLALEFSIIDPAPFEGRKVWQNLNIQHTNEQAEQIGKSQLSALCRTLGIGLLEDSDELFGKVLKIRTKVRPAQGDYGPRAEVAGYDVAGAPPVTPPPAAKPASTPPWARK